MRSSEMKLITIIPCFNEEEVFDETFKTLAKLYEELANAGLIEGGSKLCFVDDGSSDLTWQKISKVREERDIVVGIKLAKNFGHQNALLAGFSEMNGKGDAYVTIDADLQDNPNVIKDFVAEFKKGYDIIYGVRNDRTNDTFFKRFTAQSFYKVMQIFGVDVIYNHADFRLISQKVLTELLKIKERNLFLRANFPLITSNSNIVYYKRTKRFAGTSKYPLYKMLTFAINGITSFSATPLRLIFFLGLFTFILSMALTLWILLSWIFEKTIPGWTSLMAIVMFFGSIQILSLGIIAEYIGKIYIEVKKRPLFVIDEVKE